MLSPYLDSEAASLAGPFAKFTSIGDNIKNATPAAAMQMGMEHMRMAASPAANHFQSTTIPAPQTSTTFCFIRSPPAAPSVLSMPHLCTRSPAAKLVYDSLDSYRRPAYDISGEAPKVCHYCTTLIPPGRRRDTIGMFSCEACDLIRKPYSQPRPVETEVVDIMLPASTSRPTLPRYFQVEAVDSARPVIPSENTVPRPVQKRVMDIHCAATPQELQSSFTPQMMAAPTVQHATSHKEDIFPSLAERTKLNPRRASRMHTQYTPASPALQESCNTKKRNSVIRSQSQVPANLSPSSLDGVQEAASQSEKSQTRKPRPRANNQYTPAHLMVKNGGPSLGFLRGRPIGPHRAAVVPVVDKTSKDMSVQEEHEEIPVPAASSIPSKRRLPQEHKLQCASKRVCVSQEIHALDETETGTPSSQVATSLVPVVTLRQNPDSPDSLDANMADYVSPGSDILPTVDITLPPASPLASKTPIHVDNVSICSRRSSLDNVRSSAHKTLPIRPPRSNRSCMAKIDKLIVGDSISDETFIDTMKQVLRFRRSGKAITFAVKQARRILHLLELASPAQDGEALFLSREEATKQLAPDVFFSGPIITKDQQPLPLHTVEQFLEEYYDDTAQVHIQDPGARVVRGGPHVRCVTIGQVKERLADPTITDKPWNLLELATHCEDGLRPAFLNTEDCRLLSKLKIPSEKDTASRRGYQPGWKEIEKWALVAQAGALTEPHQDSHGYGTFITVNQGIIGFGFLSHPTPIERAAWCQSPFDFAGGRWRYVILRPGTTVYFPAGTVHFVFRLPAAGNTLAFGGHVLRCSQIARWAGTLLEEVRAPNITNEDITVSAPAYLEKVEGFVKQALKNGSEARWGGREKIEEFLRLKNDLMQIKAGRGSSPSSVAKTTKAR